MNKLKNTFDHRPTQSDVTRHDSTQSNKKSGTWFNFEIFDHNPQFDIKF